MANLTILPVMLFSTNQGVTHTSPKVWGYASLSTFQQEPPPLPQYLQPHRKQTLELQANQALDLKVHLKSTNSSSPLV